MAFRRRGLRRGVAQAVLAAAGMAVALGAGTALGTALADAAGLAGLPARLLPAALCTGIAVPLALLLLDRGGDGGRQAGLTGLATSLRAFALGGAVTATAALAVLGAGTAMGWVRWAALDPVTLLAFVLTNGLVALLLEALPEELTLRGVAWGALRPRVRASVAALGTTLLFLLFPLAASVVYAATAGVLHRPAPPVAFAPPGEDPASYLVLLTLFGLTLLAARVATPSASVWTCVSTHLTVLTVNRVLLQGEQRDVGWSATLVGPDAVLLVPAYLVLAAVAFWFLGHRHRPSAGSHRSAAGNGTRVSTPP